MKSNSGQALLLVIITMAVAMTVVLSVVARSITDVQITTSEEESLRAFSAAEAGVEKALVTGLQQGADILTDQGDLPDATFEAEVSSFAQNLPAFNFPLEVISGDTANVWFVSHDNNNDLVCNSGAGLPCFTGSAVEICWGSSGTPSDTATTPAIELVVFYDPTPSAGGSYTDMAVARAAFDPNGGRRGTNNFGPPDGGTCNINGVNYQFRRTVTFNSLGIPAVSQSSQNGMQLARVRMFYNSTVPHPVGFRVSGGSLPGQGRQIESTGQSGDSTRKVQVFTLFPGFPSVFDSVLFSQSPITK